MEDRRVVRMVEVRKDAEELTVYVLDCRRERLVEDLAWKGHQQGQDLDTKPRT